MIKLGLLFIAVCAGIWALKKYVPEVKDSIKKTKNGDDPIKPISNGGKILGWTNYVNIVLLIMTTAHLSCFAAAVLGFPGLLGPIHAVLDENIGNSILIFCIGMIPIVIISIKQGINWKTARTWMIVANILLAVPTVALSYMPGLNPLYNQKVQQMQCTHLNRIANSKLYIKVEEKQVAYYRELKEDELKEDELKEDELKEDWKKNLKNLLSGKTTTTAFTHKAGEFLEKSKKYYIANVKNQRSDGPHKLISIYLPDEDDDVNAGSEIVWVRLSKENGIRISSSNLPANMTGLQIVPQASYGWKVDNKGNLVANLKIGEEVTKVFRMSEEGYSTPYLVLPPEGYRLRFDHLQTIIVEEKGRGKKVVHPDDHYDMGNSQGEYVYLRFTALKGGAEIIVTLRRIKV